MKKNLLITLFLTIITFNAIAQPGTLDTSFNPVDIIGFNFGGNNKVNASATLSDGKIIIGGQFTLYNGTSSKYIARLNSDGTLDSTFNSGANSPAPLYRGANASIYSISIQTDGKILIGGQFTTYNGLASTYLARLNSDGSLDTTFNVVINDIVSTITIQNDGKIIIGGYFTSCNGIVCNHIARLNSDGTIDSTFNTGADSVVATSIVQNDGKIIIGGQFTTYNGVSRNYIARLNADGSLDSTFNPGTGGDNYVASACIQSDGKIIIAGSFTNFNGTTRNSIARLNINGSLDTTFNPGTGANNVISNVSLQSTGKIIIGGQFTSFNGTLSNYIARLNSSGVLDSTFNIGTGPNGTISLISVQNGDKIICGGMFTSYGDYTQRNLMLLNADGTLDTIFNPYTGANYYVKANVIQSNDKIVIGGSFTTYNGTLRRNIARLNSDGTLDSTFNPGTGFTNVLGTSTVNSIAIQNDGKIIVSGFFDEYNGTPINSIARLNIDGTLDPTFNSGLGLGAAVINALSVQSNGKIIIGGAFSTYNGISRKNIARLNADGTLDTTFNPGTGASSTINTIKIQSNGKIIIGGNFTTYNGIQRKYIARLNTDGSLDTAFNSGTSVSSQVLCASIQSDGKIYIGGVSFIMRLYSDGTNDLTFTPNSGSIDGTIRFVLIQNDGKIISAGTYVKRFNSDGTLDDTFSININASNYFSANFQSDGKIIVTALYTIYANKNGVARINGGTALANSEFEKENIVVYPNPTQNIFHIDIDNEFTGSIYDVTGKSIMNVNTKNIDISSLSAGIYFLKITCEGKSYIKKIIKE